MNTLGRVGRSVLAVLLVALTCLGPVGLTTFTDQQNAYAEETTTENQAPEQEQAVAEEEETEAAAVADDSAQDEAVEEGSEAPALMSENEEAAENTLTTASIADDDNALESEALTTEAVDEASSDEANEDDADKTTFDIGSSLELYEAFKYEIGANSGKNYTINLTNDVALVKPTERVDSHGKRIVLGTDKLIVKNGNTVTILGHGHTLQYTDASTNNYSLGASGGGTLILGSADGSDTLNITFSGSSEVEPLLTVTGNGNAVINNGVTLSNNVNRTLLPGGAICIQSGSVVTMNGGVIENCSNDTIPYGGAVAVDGGTFYMNAGVIKGNSEPDVANNYQGSGGAVAVGLHGTTSTFVMGGNAVIEGNTAKYGGGVFVGPNATFTMKDNAAILNNTATQYGGGVYVEQGGTFTMGENNTIKGNNAQQGGGILNFGTASVTNVYDNDAAVAAADIYNAGTLTMEDTKADWSLSRAQATSDPTYKANSESTTPVDDTTPDMPVIKFMSLAALSEPAATIDPNNTNIDGWYYDGHRETGETDADGNKVVERNRWNANEDTADVPQYLQSYAVTGAPTNEVMGLKAAHGTATEPPDIPKTINVIWENYDGSELFTLSKVDAEHVPDADEYEALSGNDNPTEASDATNDYEFEGWDRSEDPDGDVIYTAEYDAIPKDGDHTPKTHETDDPKPIPDNPGDKKPGSDQPRNEQHEADHPRDAQQQVEENVPQMGDRIALLLGTGIVGIAAAGALGVASYKLQSNRKEKH